VGCSGGILSDTKSTSAEMIAREARNQLRVSAVPWREMAGFGGIKSLR
jgi:hypothetical protein